MNRLIIITALSIFPCRILAVPSPASASSPAPSPSSNSVASQLDSFAKQNGIDSGQLVPVQAPTNYANGTCSFHLDEYWSCQDDTKNLYATMSLKDAAGNDIGCTQSEEPDSWTTGAYEWPEGADVPINAQGPYTLKSGLPYDLIVVGEHRGDYVQFQYNMLKWTSTESNGEAGCEAGYWDPLRGPDCSDIGSGFSQKSIHCKFPC